MSKTSGIRLINYGHYYRYVGYDKKYVIGELIEAYVNLDMSIIRDIVMNCRYYHDDYNRDLIFFASYEIRKEICLRFGVIGEMISNEIENYALNYDENEVFYQFHYEPLILPLVFKDTPYTKPGRESMAQCLLTGLYMVWVIHLYTTTTIIPKYLVNGNIIDFDSHDISCEIIYENNELIEIIELPDIKSLLCFEYSSILETLA